MGRKLNVALLLTLHLTFIACAVLIVSPLMTEEGNQVDQRLDDTITADEFAPFLQASTYSRGQKSMEGLRRTAPDRQRQFDQRLKLQWERANDETQEGQ
jgi:predicted PurR-regulated permease PerM